MCVIESSDKKGKNLVSYVANFRNAEIYLARIKPTHRRHTLQRRCVRFLRECRKLKISLFAMNSSDVLYGHLLAMGINIIDERRFFKSRIAEMAKEFSKKTESPFEFYILGGDVRTVAETAAELLSVCRNVYADIAAFEEASVLVLEKAGVPLRKRQPGEKCVRIELSPGGVIFRCGDKSAALCDFEMVGFPTAIKKHFRERTAALAALLEICGVLGKNEVKTAYLTK